MYIYIFNLESLFVSLSIYESSYGPALPISVPKKTLIARLIAKTTNDAGCILHDKGNCTVTERQLTAPFSRTNGPVLPVVFPGTRLNTPTCADTQRGGYALFKRYFTRASFAYANPCWWIMHSMHIL